MVFKRETHPPGNSPSHAALYQRVSTEAQDDHGSSLGTQEAAARKYCIEHGFTPEFIFTETWSGLTLDRPQLNQLREFARSRRIDAIVVYSTDRLSRDPVHLLLLLEEWDKLGVKTHFITEPRDDTLEGQLITFVRGWTGKVEAVKIAERTQRGRRERAREGKLPTGTRRYGWNYDPATGKRAINPTEAQVMRDVVSWVVRDGLSLGAIREQLREKEILAPEGGQYWGLSTIRRILRDPALIGESFGYRYRCVEPKNGPTPRQRYPKTRREERPRDEWISLAGATPPILSRQEFDQLQQALKRNSELQPRDQRHQYLLAGFLYCATCGSRYYGEPGRGKRCYRCAGRRSVIPSERCRNPQISADSLESALCAWFDGIWTRPDILRLVLLRSNKPENRDPLEAKLGAVSVKLEKLIGKEARMVHCYVVGQFDEGVLEREGKQIAAERERLTGERADISQRLEDLAATEIDRSGLEQLQDLMAERWLSMGFNERRQVFNRLKLKLEVTSGREVLISGLFPTPSKVVKAIQDEFPHMSVQQTNNGSRGIISPTWDSLEHHFSRFGKQPLRQIPFAAILSSQGKQRKGNFHLGGSAGSAERRS